MTPTTPPVDPEPSLTRLRQVDAVCRRFEAAWQTAATLLERPRIEAFLDAMPEAAHPQLIHELVALEIDLRRQGGEEPHSDEYRARFPLLPSADNTCSLTSPPRRPAPDAPRVDVPGFETLHELGRGGMGVVYLAWQSSLRRAVALKMLRAGAHAGPEELARFRTEAEAIGRLHHPNIVQVYDIGCHESCPYMALEHINGGSLAKHIGDTPQPAREAAALVETLARAVHYAHEHGIVHRDLTPANVLLAHDEEPSAARPGDAVGGLYGVPKITDFGLAKLIIGGGPTLTQRGAIMGTPSYMAPEQTMGRSGPITPSADVYSLGAILYQLLTGQPPFKADTALETILEVQSAEPVSPRRLQPRLPRDLATITMKCLAKAPGRRYASALALAEDLERFLAGEPIRARPVGQAERLWRWCRRNPVIAALTGTVFLLLLTLTAGALAKNTQLSVALTDSKAANHQAEAKLWESLHAQARALRMSRVPGQRLDSLRSIRQALALPVPPGHSVAELQTEAIAALALPDLEVVREWNGFPAGSVALDFDPGLERYARQEIDGTVSVRRVRDDTPIAQWRGPAPLPESEGSLRFSPDGRFLAIRHSGSRALTVLRLDGAAGIVCHQAAKEVRIGAWFAMDFSPDSKRLAYLLTDSRIAVVDLASGQVSYLRRSGGEDEGTIRFAPDGRRFALIVRRKAVWAIEVRDAATGAVQQRLPHDPNVQFLAWHPDGRTLATCCIDRVIRLWDVASAQVWRELKGHMHGGIRCAFSSTGDRLVSNDWSSLLRVWEPSSGKQLLSCPARNFDFLRLSPDDRVPAMESADPTKLQLLRLHPGLEYRSIALNHNTWGRDVPFDVWAQVHPDGRLLAATASDNSVALLDLSAGREVGQLPSPCYLPLRWEESGHLLTCGGAGLLRWPVRTAPADAGRYRFGPPQRLDSRTTYHQWGTSADTLTIAIPSSDWGTLLVHRSQPPRLVALEPQKDVRSCAVSPDGRWVASGSHKSTDGFGAQVWNAATGKLEIKLPVGPLCRVVFSPDNRWLLTTGGGCRLWKVNSWEEMPSVGGVSACFSANGSVLAVGEANGAVRLVHPGNAASYARLEAPAQARLQPLCFSRDGARLIAHDTDTNTLHIWDLRAVREGLVELGLQRELPPFPPANAAAAPRIRVDVEWNRK